MYIQIYILNQSKDILCDSGAETRFSVTAEINRNVVYSVKEEYNVRIELRMRIQSYSGAESSSYSSSSLYSVSTLLTKPCTFELEVCKKIRFDFRSDIGFRRMQNVEYSTSKAPFFGCRIFDIRSASVECRIIDIRSRIE